MEPGAWQYFNTSIEGQEYASGGKAPYQRAFIIILVPVFVISLSILVYVITHRQWYVDFSEPGTLFCLAINSPPSKDVVGRCEMEPEGEQLCVAWKLKEANGHVYMKSVDRDVTSRRADAELRRGLSKGVDIMMTRIKKTTRRSQDDGVATDGSEDLAPMIRS
jgi:hypothetical protein